MFSNVNVPTTLLNSLAALGLFLVLPVLYRFLTFIWIYFLRPSSVKNYLTGPAPYALITGATDGIGKAVAKQLYRRGFNLILHGRNEEKTKNVIQEIKASGGDKDIRYFLADATMSGHDFPKLLEEFEDLNITLVMNNVGGTAVKLTRIDEWTDEEVYGTLHWSALFTMGITRAILPQLRRSPGPVLVMSVGSYAGDTPPPRLALYGASKRFVEFLTRGLSVDERYYTSTNVRFMYLCVGQVSTNAFRGAVNFVCPDADTFAKAVVNRIGCGQRRLAPYVGHVISQWSVEVFGEWVSEMIVATAMRQIITTTLKDRVKAD